MTFPQILYEKWWKKICTQVTQILAGGRSKKKKKKLIFFSSNLAYYIFLERKFNFQYNSENFKCIAYPEQKFSNFKKPYFLQKISDVQIILLTSAKIDTWQANFFYQIVYYIMDYYCAKFYFICISG